MDVRAIGRAAVELGAGRLRLEDTVDPAVGFHLTVKPGDRVETGEAIATVHAADAAAAERAGTALRAAIEVGDGVARPLPLIARRITAEGTEPLAVP